MVGQRTSAGRNATPPSYPEPRPKLWASNWTRFSTAFAHACMRAVMRGLAAQHGTRVERKPVALYRAWKVLTGGLTARSHIGRPRAEGSSGQDSPCPVLFSSLVTAWVRDGDTRRRV